jgi:phosphatidylinositol kinase/protein kinase (PI-3  family)
MLASAMGPHLTKLLHEQIELMFECDLSDCLHQALVAITKHIPPLLKTIQGMLGLLRSHFIDLILDRAPFGQAINNPEWEKLQTSWCPL